MSFVTAAVFVILREIADNRDLNDQLTETQKLADQIKDRKVSENNKKSDETVGNLLQSVDKSGHVQNSASASDVSASDKQIGIELPPDFPVVTGVPKIPFWERLGLDPPMVICVIVKISMATTTKCIGDKYLWVK